MELSSYFPIWDKLKPEEQRALNESAREVHFHRGDIIHTDGDCMGLLLVISGQLRAYTASEGGREITLYRLFERDICLFTASCMMRSLQFDITVSAEKDTAAYLISPELYRSVMDNSAPLALFTNEIMAARFSDVMWLFEQIMWHGVDRRLAEFLLNESGIEQSDTLSLTHEEIGNHIGSPREVVTRILKYFRDEGIVSLARGAVEIKDYKRLKLMAG